MMPAIGLEPLRREIARREADIALDDRNTIRHAVALDVAFRETGKFRLQFEAGHFKAGHTRGEAEACDADTGARFERPLAFARRHGGREGEQAMRVYQQAAIELGFLHHRYLRGTPPPDFAVRGQEHVLRISAVRPSIAFPGQVVPTRMSAR